MSSRTEIPAWMARLISLSRLNLSILLCRRSFSRGCVTPRRRAASACVTSQLLTFCCRAMRRFDRMVIFADSSGLSVSASQTFAYSWCSIVLPSMAVRSNFLQAAFRQVQISFGRLLGLLLEGVQHIDGALDIEVS